MKILRSIKEKLFPAPIYVKYQGIILPPAHRRFCGLEFKDDAFFLQSAKKEAQRLIEKMDCTTGSRVLDIGCGQGRLAIGLQQFFKELDYTGLDVDRQSVEWCQTYLHKNNPTYKFLHVDVANERYNREGRLLNESFQFDFPDQHFDIIYLYSVFSHMEEADVNQYLKDFNRILKSNGKVFFTTFVEENVEPVVVNPPGYAVEAISGPLHVVRFEKEYLFNLSRSHNFEVTGFEYGTETNGQSGIYLLKK